jgi:hypothetical protein
VQEIRYAANDTEVRLGGHVMYRSMLLRWRWKHGRVSYVPGTSKPHPEMEHNGLQWVGVSGVDGTFRGVLVEPGQGHIRPSVRFRARFDGSKFLTPDEIPDNEW